MTTVRDFQHEDFDLCSWEVWTDNLPEWRRTERKPPPGPYIGRRIMVVAMNKNGDSWRSQDLPAEGCFSVFAPLLVETFPYLWNNETAALFSLTAWHWRNMKQKQNIVGQPYPFKITAGYFRRAGDTPAFKPKGAIREINL